MSGVGDPIDYALVLTVVINSDDPARDLRAFVEQEREHTQHTAVTAALTAVADEIEAAQSFACNEACCSGSSADYDDGLFRAARIARRHIP